MTQENTNTALATIDVKEVQAIIAEAPAVLAHNATSLQKALARAEVLKTAAQQNGMSDPLDEQIAHYVTKATATVKAMNERRKPFTQTVDAVKKEFTSMENTLKAQTGELQAIRDQYVAEKMKEQRRREAEAQRKLQAERERIRIREAAEIALGENAAKLISRYKTQLADLLESATTQNIDSVHQAIASHSIEVTHETLMAITPRVPYDQHLITDEAYTQIIQATMEAGAAKAGEEIAHAIASYRRQLLDEIPSKKEELEQIAKATAEQRKQLEADAEERREREQRRMAEEEQQRKAAAREQASTKAAADLFESSVTAQAEIGEDQTQRVKEAVQIQIKNRAAYALIFQFWFEKEGRSMDEAKLEKMSVARMKAFCERHALKTGETINSSLLEYIETYKAK